MQRSSRPSRAQAIHADPSPDGPAMGKLVLGPAPGLALASSALAAVAWRAVSRSFDRLACSDFLRAASESFGGMPALPAQQQHQILKLQGRSNAREWLPEWDAQRSMRIPLALSPACWVLRCICILCSKEELAACVRVGDARWRAAHVLRFSHRPPPV